MPLVRGRYPVTNPVWLLNGKPSGPMRANLDRRMVEGNLSALTTQVALAVALPLEAGDIVSALTFVSGATGAGTPTNYWVALYDDSTTPALLGQSADQTSAAWAASTAKTLALATPYLVPRSGIYFASIMVKASTPPTLVGTAVNANASAAVIAGQAILARTHGATLTDTAPSTITGATTVGNVPLVIAT